MFDIELNNIARITERVLGQPKNATNIDGWNEFNCPRCSEEDGVESDGKYNCCVNYREGYFHCWKCGYAGKISRVLKDYGGSSVVGEYYDEIRNITMEELQEMIDKYNKIVDEKFKEKEVELTSI